MKKMYIPGPFLRQRVRGICTSQRASHFLAGDLHELVLVQECEFRRLRKQAVGQNKEEKGGVDRQEMGERGKGLQRNRKGPGKELSLIWPHGILTRESPAIVWGWSITLRNKDRKLQTQNDEIRLPHPDEEPESQQLTFPRETRAGESWDHSCPMQNHFSSH